jgi:hypothetical protein
MRQVVRRLPLPGEVRSKLHTLVDYIPILRPRWAMFQKEDK